MKRKEEISNEILNAFVDDQMTLEDKEELYSAINEDDDLNQKVCEIRKVRDLVQTAYRDVPVPPNSKQLNSFGDSNWRNLAAGFVLALGIVVGWQINNFESDGNVSVASAGARTGNQIGKMKVLFHLNSDKPETVSETLLEVENVLQHYERTGQKAVVEVITNGNGLSMLRRDTTKHAEHIKAMQQKYSNLVFVACQNTINRLKHETGITAQLLDGVVVIDSGVAQIMRRQHQGWAYIQV